ncbi:MAG: cytochrome c biogenesis CcdA family protein [Bacillota bacterium]
MLDSVYVLSFVEGVLTFISPCILPLLPVYLFYLAGTSDGDSKEVQNKGRLLLNSIGFVLGFTIVFVLLGAAATSLGTFLRSHKDVFKMVSSLIMIVFGLNFIGVFRIGFLNTEKRFEYKFDKLKFLGSLIFGMVFAFGWTPCVGAFLGSVLMMAANSDTLLDGVLLLLVYSVGLGVPFLITAMIFDNIRGAFRFIQEHTRIISAISGGLLILAGIAMFFNMI